FTGTERGGEGLRRAVVLWIAIAAGAVVPASAATRARARQPDLKVTVFQVHLGNPAYDIVSSDDVLEPIEVHVVTMNQGDRAAGKSVTEIFFHDSRGQRFQKRIDVPALPAHKPFETTTELRATNPSLGFAKLGAEADAGKQVTESDESNNLVGGERFAILAREWSAKSFDTITKRGSADQTTFIRGGFRFVFSRFDHTSRNYVYKPYGSITDQAHESGVCSGSSNKTRTHSPWANSYLHIAE